MSERTSTNARPAPMRGHGRGPLATQAPAEKALNFGPSVRRLLGHLRPERAVLGCALVFALGAVLLNVIGPRILGWATDVVWNGAVVDRAAGIDFGELGMVLMLAAGCYLVAVLLGFAQGWLLNGAVQRSVRRMRGQVEDKLNRLPLSYFDKTARGELLSRVTNDIDNVAQVLQQTLAQLVNALLMVIGVIIMMFLTSPILAVIALITVPVTLGISAVIGSRAQRRFIENWAATGALNAQVEEAYTGHQLVKVFGRQREVEAEFAQRNERLFAAGFASQFLSGLIMPATMLIGNLNYVVIAVVGGLRVAGGQMTIGEVQAFIQYSRQFTQPLSQIAAMANLLQSGVASAERVFEVLDAAEQSAEPSGALARPVRGRVVFDDVSFSYDPDSELITGLDLVAEPGQTVAIVGPTGAGKTTLVNLLMRFYDVQGGVIALDGVDLAGVPRKELRAVTGMVLQDSWLFGGTIRDNIAYGRLDATEEELLAAARAAYVDRFVHALPDGYDTVIDEEADNVSAGEKQLITIARAFLADPALLILDEATSSVDTRTEVLVQQAMARLRADRTSFVIAHRLSTIRDADVILVMEKGRIVEQGTHAELLERHGAYRRLYDAQFSAPVTDEQERAVGTS
ncbi:ABC transporter ATP-binding protein [Naumannella huperziae]